MIIYMNKEPRFFFKRWQRIAHMFLPRLYGVNIVFDNSGKDPEVMPVYIPFIRYEFQHKQLLLEFSGWTDDAIVFLFFTRWPFVYVTRGGGIELDIREMEDF